MIAAQNLAGWLFWLVVLAGAVALAVLGRGTGRLLGLVGLGLMVLGAALNLTSGIAGLPVLAGLGWVLDLLGVAMLVLAVVVASRGRENRAVRTGH